MKKLISCILSAAIAAGTAITMAVSAEEGSNGISGYTFDEIMSMSDYELLSMKDQLTYDDETCSGHSNSTFPYTISGLYSDSLLAARYKDSISVSDTSLTVCYAISQEVTDEQLADLYERVDFIDADGIPGTRYVTSVDKTAQLLNVPADIISSAYLLNDYRYRSREDTLDLVINGIAYAGVEVKYDISAYGEENAEKFIASVLLYTDQRTNPAVAFRWPDYHGAGASPVFTDYSFNELMAMDDDTLKAFTDPVSGFENVQTVGELYSEMLEESPLKLIYENLGRVTAVIKLKDEETFQSLYRTKYYTGASGEPVEATVMTKEAVAEFLGLPPEIIFSVYEDELTENSVVVNMNISMYGSENVEKFFALADIRLDENYNSGILSHYYEHWGAVPEETTTTTTSTVTTTTTVTTTVTTTQTTSSSTQTDETVTSTSTETSTTTTEGTGTVSTSSDTTTVTQTDEPGTLPQTGYSGRYKAIACIAVLMTLTGSAIVVKSGKGEEN